MYKHEFVKRKLGMELISRNFPKIILQIPNDIFVIIEYAPVFIKITYLWCICLNLRVVIWERVTSGPASSLVNDVVAYKYLFNKNFKIYNYVYSFKKNDKPCRSHFSYGWYTVILLLYSTSNIEIPRSI